MPGGIALPPAEQIEEFNRRMAGGRIVKSGLDIDLADPAAEKRIIESLHSLKSSGACGSIQSFPLGAQQLAGASRLQSVFDGSESVAGGLNVGLAEKNSGEKLQKAFEAFQSCGREVACQDFRLERLLPAFSRMAQLAKAAEWSLRRRGSMAMRR